MRGPMVNVIVDRPLGSAHPDYPDLIYPINYGYIEGTMAEDGEEEDAYILGVNVPVTSFRGRVIGVIIRKNDNENKYIVAPDGVVFTAEEIRKAVHFQEKYFDITISLYYGKAYS